MLGAPAPCAKTADSANDLDSPSQWYPILGGALAVSGELDIQMFKEKLALSMAFHSMKEFTFGLGLISSTVCSLIRKKYVFPRSQVYLVRKKNPCKAHSVPGLRVQRHDLQCPGLVFRQNQRTFHPKDVTSTRVRGS